MLGTGLNELVNTQALDIGAIVQVTDYLQNTVQNRKYVSHIHVSQLPRP
jgi:Replication factor-A protein 1, N-terminal domain